MAKGYLERLLGEQEKINLVTRQHWFVVLGSIFVEIVAIIVLITIAIVAGLLDFPKGWEALQSILVALAVLMLLLPFITLTYDILVWWNRQYIVSNRRVVQISGIFNKNVTDSSLEKVNDVKLSQSVLGRIFGYGDVEILTASELGVNLFRRIEDPVRFKTAMINAKEKLERGMADIMPGEAPKQTDYTGLFEQLEKLHEQGILTDDEYASKKADLLAKM